MTKFADELFADLMREHGPVLERPSRQTAHNRVVHTLTVEPGPPRPPRHTPFWMAPAAAAVGVTLVVGLAVSLGGLFTGRGHANIQIGSGGTVSRTAYVFNRYKGTLTPISPVTGRLGKPFKVGPAGAPGSPNVFENAITPDGKTDYVVYTATSGSVIRSFDLVTHKAGTPIQLGHGTGQVVFTPDYKTAYFASSSSSNLNKGTVRPVSLATGTVGSPVVQGQGVPFIAITPDGKTAYVSFSQPGTVTPVSVATNTPGRTIPVTGAYMINITSDGGTADVTGSGGPDSSPMWVTPISTATSTPGQRVRIGNANQFSLVAPDGTTAFYVGASNVRLVSLTTGQTVRTLDLGSTSDAAFTPDSKTVYVLAGSSGHAEVTPVSETGTVGKSIHVSGNPQNIVMSQDGKTVYAYGSPGDKQTMTPISTATNTAGTPVSVRASGFIPGYIGIVLPGEENAW
ncbi:MAG TPA: hypothetical protein VGS19_00815 [Streptosporangiaceae bacterium]|nr:hypothetical protein [Streptosporangiaceae bacterium]